MTRRVITALLASLILMAPRCIVAQTSMLGGAYSGVVDDNLAGAGTLSMTISVSGAVVSGTFVDAFPGRNLTNSGTIDGSFDGTIFQGMAKPSVNSSCPFNFTAVTSGDRTTLTGTYAAINCSRPDGGTLKLTRQSALDSPAAASVQQSSTSIYSSIQPSLALVVARSGNKTYSGSAFCIGSHENVAYFLTNRHVVGDDPFPRVVLQSDTTSLLHGQVVRTATFDAVVLAVQNAKCPPLTISQVAPKTGTAIGIAGFPAIQLSLSEHPEEATPSFHQGSVSALVRENGWIEYDAQTDHGNSGSPLFDMQSGVVYGIVTLASTGTTGALQNNFAIPTSVLRHFLDNSGASVAYAGADTEPIAPQESPVLAEGDNASSGPKSGISPAAPGTVAGMIDSKCGAGITAGWLTDEEKANAEENANDYARATADAQKIIESAYTCGVSFVSTCEPDQPCQDAPHVLIQTFVLFAQQVVRTSAARTNGDSINAMSNELTTALDLCDSPNIMTDANVYVRNEIASTLRVSSKLTRVRQVASRFDSKLIEACASRINVSL